jgi:NAD+ synthase
MTETEATDYADLADGIAGWLRARMTDAGASRLVVGLSGGIDSAVVCALCTMAAGSSRVIAAILPIHSEATDLRDAESVARTFEVTTQTIDLGPVYDAFLTAMPNDRAPGLQDANIDPDVAEQRRQLALANIKPRLRMATLYYLANRFDGLVVGTGNKTELSVGYFTKYGDGGVDLLPLGELLKTDVRGLARELGVPAAVIDKAPSAGLWQGQTDEAELGISYPELDAALAAMAGDGVDVIDSDIRGRVSRLVSASEHKRAPVPVYSREPEQPVARRRPRRRP